MAINTNFTQEEISTLIEASQSGVMPSNNMGMTSGELLRAMATAGQVMRDLHDSRQVDPRKMHAQKKSTPKKEPTAPDVLRNPTRRIIL